MVRVTQRSWAAGELAPGLQHRPDVPRLKNGLKTMRNWWLSRDTTLENCPGFQYLGAAKANDTETIMVPWAFNDRQGYSLEVGDLYVRFWYQGSRMLTGAASAWGSGNQYLVGDIVTRSSVYYIAISANPGASTSPTPGAAPLSWYALTDSGASAILEVPSPWPKVDLALLSWNQAGDVLTVRHKDYDPREIVRFGHVNWGLRIAEYRPSRVPPTGIVAGAATGSAGGKDYRYSVTSIGEDKKIETILGAGAVILASYPTVPYPTPVWGAYVADDDSDIDMIPLSMASPAASLPAFPVAHGLTDDSLVRLTGAGTSNSVVSTANEYLRAKLENTLWKVEINGAYMFKLRGSCSTMSSGRPAMWPSPTTRSQASSSRSQTRPSATSTSPGP